MARTSSVVPGLAVAQLRHRPVRWLLVSLGVALAAGLVVLAQGLSVLVADRALRQGLAQLPVGERSVAVSFDGFLDGPGELAAVDAVVRERLTGVTTGQVQAQMIFREVSNGQGESFFLGGADDLADRVRLLSGRLPTSCTPSRCEVVVVGGESAPQGLGALGLEVVGRVERTDPLLLSGGFQPTAGVPLLVADEVDSARTIGALERFQRGYGWVAPVDVDRIRELGVEGYLERSTEVQDDLYRSRTGLILAAPNAVLVAEADRAERSARRFALLGGSAAALLLGFAVLGAVGLRRDQGELVDLLRRRGAGRRQVGGLVVLEGSLVIGAGVVGGVVGGAAAVAWLAGREGLEPGPTAALAVSAAGPGAVVLGAAALLLVVSTLLWPPEEETRAWRAVDAVLVVAGLLVVVALSRGGVDVGSLDERVDPLLVLLPVLAAVVTGLVAARLWPVVAGLVQRALPRRALAGRLALLGGIREPLRVAGTTAFVAATVCSIVFAGAYGATLAEGAADRAVFETGLDVRVVVGPSGASPLVVASVADFEGLADGATATAVVRSTVGVRRGVLDTVAVQVVGLDPAVLPEIRRWDRVVGGEDPQALAGALATPPVLPGATLPDGGRLALPATGPLRSIAVTGWFRAADGREVGVPLRLSGWRPGPTLGTGSGVLEAAVPPTLGEPVTLYRLVMRQPTDDATRREHNIGEGGSELPVVAGTMVFDRPSVDGVGVDDPWQGWGSSGAGSSVEGGSLEVDVRLTGQPVVVGPGLGAPEAVLPVLTDPETAAQADPSGALVLTLGDAAPLAVRVVGTAPRFPTAPARFVVADGATVASLLDARAPGEGNAREVWVADPSGGESLLAPLGAEPYDLLETTLRPQRESELAADPVARGASTMLALSAIVALLVAAVALVLLVVSDRRDGAGELYAWEVDGVAPASLRRLLVVRAASVVLVALPLGLAGGLLLAGATARLVGLTATGGSAQPPPQLAVGGGWVGAVLVLGLAGAMVVVGAVAALALREPLPERVPT